MSATVARGVEPFMDESFTEDRGAESLAPVGLETGGTMSTPESPAGAGMALYPAGHPSGFQSDLWFGASPASPNGASVTAASVAAADAGEGMRLTSSRGRGLLIELARLREQTERSDAWPATAWQRVVESGLLGWGIPVEHGGHACSTREMLEAYIDVSRACLTTAFILTQRNSAVQKLVDSDRAELKERLLPPIAAGQLHVTLGISHLTTSRQYMVRPVVEARSAGSGLVLEGEIPWVTAAPQADLIVTGASFRDGRQVLALVPTDARGVHVHTPGTMMALNASQTSVVTLDGVEVPARYLLAGPVENVMRKTGGGTGSLSTSALAIGQTRYALCEMAREAERRPDLADFVSALTEECDRLERSLLVSATPPAFPIDAAWLRTLANSLVTRTTQAWMALAKGAGYMDQHPAAIAVRQALFFFVWSCPQPVLTAALRELTMPRGE